MYPLPHVVHVKLLSACEEWEVAFACSGLVMAQKLGDGHLSELAFSFEFSRATKPSTLLLVLLAVSVVKNPSREKRGRLPPPLAQRRAEISPNAAQGRAKGVSVWCMSTWGGTDGKAGR